MRAMLTTKIVILLVTYVDKPARTNLAREATCAVKGTYSVIEEMVFYKKKKKSQTLYVCVRVCVCVCVCVCARARVCACVCVSVCV